MSYRFVKVTTYYRDYLKQYYAKNPQLQGMSYDSQFSHLMSQAYSWSDFFSQHLRTMGVDAHEIVANAELLQQTWANEHGVAAKGTAVVFEQIKALKPDVVMFQDSFVFNGEWINLLRREIPSIKLIIGWCCTNYTNDHLEQFKPFDFFLVCSPKIEADLNDFGLKAIQMHHGFEASLLPKLAIDNPFPESDFIFLGSIVPGARGHNLRRDVLNALVDQQVEIDLYAHFLTIRPMDLLMRRSAYAISKMLSGIGLSSVAKTLPLIKKAYYLEEMPSNPTGIEKLQRIAKPSIYGIDMLKALSRSKIGFNYHGEGAGEYAANIRLFEVTGVGSCLITDWKKNLHEFFEVDSEVVAFRSADECIEKVRWLLDHPTERESIAAAGQRRVLRDHSYKDRAQKLHSIITENLKHHE